MAWLRLYDTLLDNPKVQRLRPELFKALVNLWCLAKRYDGGLPDVSEIAFALRGSEQKIVSWISELRDAGLIDETDGTLHPHDWDHHQFKSDNVSERVKKHRANRHRNGNGNGGETLRGTPPETETETETEQSRAELEDAPQAAPPTRYAFEGEVIKLNRRDFDAWAKAYPNIDLLACLQSRDDWLRETPERHEGWFHSTSTWLSNKSAVAAKGNGAASTFQDTDERGWRNRYEAAAKNNGTWPDSWGPAPGMPGHCGPPEMEQTFLLNIPEQLRRPA